MILGDARAVDQSGLAPITGARVDFVEPDQSQPFEALARIRITATSTIATAWNSTRLRIHACCCSPVTSLPDAMAMTPRTSTYAVAAIATRSRIIITPDMARPPTPR